MNRLSKKIVYCAVVLFSLSNVECWAKDKNPWFPPTNLAIIKKGYIELCGGFQQASLLYSGLKYPGLKQNIAPSIVGGLTYRYQIGDYFSVAGMGYFSQQGISMGGEEHNYILKSNNIGLFIPVEYYITLNEERRKLTILFLQAGPYIAAPFDGSIKSGDYSATLNNSNIAPIDYGFECGAGLRIMVFSLQGRSYIRLRLSYFRGFANTYATNELNGVTQSLNQSHYNISGTRQNQGVRITAGFEIPLKKEGVTTYTAGGDNKRTYKRFANFF